MFLLAKNNKNKLLVEIGQKAAKFPNDYLNEIKNPLVDFEIHIIINYFHAIYRSGSLTE